MKAYAKAILDNEAQKLSRFSAGRNYGLYCVAANVGKYLHHGLLSLAAVENALIGASVTNGYVAAKHGGLDKTSASLRSGLEKARGDALPTLGTRERKKRA